MNKKFKSYYTFNFLMDKVFETVINLKSIDSVFSDIRSQTTMVKGFNTYTPGNTFFYLVNSSKVEFEVISCMNQESLKSIRWKTKADNIEYYCEYNLYKCCQSGNCVLEWVLDIETNIQIDKEAILESQNETMRRVQNYLGEQTTTEIKTRLIIKAERNSIIKLILDLNNIKNISKYFGTIKYLGESNKAGSKLIFDYSFLDFELVFCIDSIEISSKVKRWKYTIQAASSKSLIKTIQLSVFKIHNRKSVVEVTHVFSKCLSPEKLQNFEKEQLGFLTDLASSIPDSSTNK